MNSIPATLPDTNPYHQSKYILAWHVKQDELNLLQSFDTARIDTSEPELQQIQGSIIEMLGTILVTLIEKPRLIRQELASLHHSLRTWVPVNRIDLATFNKQTINSVWEFKKTISQSQIESEQITIHNQTYADKFKIGVRCSKVQDPRIRTFTSMMTDLQLDPDIETFIHKTLYQVQESATIQNLTTPLHILRATIDHIHFATRPHRQVIPALRNNIEQPQYHPCQPKGNCFVINHSNPAKPNITQTSIRPYILPDHKAFTTHITFQGSKIPKPFTLAVFWGVPPREYIPLERSIITRDQIYQEDDILEKLELMLRQQSSDLNTWHILTSLNISFQDLLHTKRLTVNVV